MNTESDRLASIVRPGVQFSSLSCQDLVINENVGRVLIPEIHAIALVGSDRPFITGDRMGLQRNDSGQE